MMCMTSLPPGPCVLQGRFHSCWKQKPLLAFLRCRIFGRKTGFHPRLRGGGYFPENALVPRGNAPDRVDHSSIRAVERSNAFHLVIGEHEPENIEILRDTLGVRGSRNGCDIVLLSEPA